MSNRNLSKKYKYGVAVGNSLSMWKPYLFGGSIEESIYKTKEWGYEAVELHNITNPEKVDAESILYTLKKYNIEVSAISTGPAYYQDRLDLTDDSYQIRKNAANRLKQYVNLAEKIGGLITIGTMRGNIPDLISLKDYKNKLAQSLKEVSLYAGEKEVTLLLEVSNRYEINYLNRTDEIYDFIISSGLPNLKIHMDTFHMNIEEVDIFTAIVDYGELLGYFHIADSNRMYPGLGHIDFYKVRDALSNIHYKGFIILECLPIPDGKTAAVKTLSFLNDIF